MRVKQSIYQNIINIVLSLPNSKNGPQEVFRVWFRVFWSSMMCINLGEIIIIKHTVTCLKLLDYSSYVYSFSPGLPPGTNNISRWLKCGPLNTAMISMTWVTVHFPELLVLAMLFKILRSWMTVLSSFPLMLWHRFMTIWKLPHSCENLYITATMYH